jgi:hypothetical protein
MTMEQMINPKTTFNYKASGLQDVFEFSAPDLKCCREMKFFYAQGSIRPGMTMFYEEGENPGYYFYNRNHTWWRKPIRMCPWCGKKIPKIEVK